ncbi:MAG: hypothetical protein HETSPECPRED_005030 [Heterodermia speciosa]|uniref:Uncharacterized protein n=1 Tax=Heterodermia speciosa TaxID=116794 RepID=A0A8H3FD09_9LECA|nr:MAG: hypothetical protein HETSPECPRED_005030 [Heterodermia speciosa]
MPDDAKGKTREHVKGAWKWIMGDMPLTPALKQQASTLSQQRIRGTRHNQALTGRPAPDAIAKAWEWIIGEQPLEPPKKQKAKRFKVPKLGKLKRLLRLPKWKKISKPAPELTDEDESGLVTHQSGPEVSDGPPHSDADSEFETHADRDDESDDEEQHHRDGEPDHPPPGYTSTAPTSS